MAQSLNIVQDITPLSVFRQNASEIIKNMGMCHKTHYITVNGKVEAVVQDAQTYQAQMDKIEELETLLSIQRGLDDVKHNRVKALDSVIQGIKARHEDV